MQKDPCSHSLLSAKDVAERLGVSIRTVRVLMASGAIATVRPTPGRVKVDKRDLDAYIASCRKPAGGEK